MRRPVPGQDAPDSDALATRRRRAVEEPLDVRLRSREPFVDLEVRNPIHRTRYRVLFPEFPLRDSAFCSCTDFARRGLGTCKHVEAGWSWLQSPLREIAEPVTLRPRPVSANHLWREIERRTEQLGRSDPATIREVDRAGAVLYERREGDGQERGRPAAGRGRPGRPSITTSSRARS